MAGLREMSGCLTAALAILIVMNVPAVAGAQQSCSSEPLALQVLGSGGPYAGGTRASTGYLVWQGGRAAVLIDAGGGVFLRFGEAGARLQDLSLVAISHLHPDHVSDLPALLWLSELSRTRPLAIAGPSERAAFPAFDTFLSRLFDASNGAFPILAGTLGQRGQGVRLDLAVMNADRRSPQAVHSDGTVEVSAIGVPHGNVPTVAYRVRIGDRSVVFGADQNGTDPSFSEFASEADVLVMHLAASQQAPPPVAQVHARPATVGEVAAKSGAKRLVLSHFIGAPSTVNTPAWFSLSNLDQAVAEVRRHFSGPIEVARDLLCVPIR